MTGNNAPEALAGKRAFQVDDLFQIEQLGRYFGGPVSFSPDGRSLALVLQRAKATATLHKQEYLWGNDRADIWLVDLPDGTPHRITNGFHDGSGFWAPAWSPDGQQLAMLSTRGGNVTLWVWERATGTLRQMTRRGVDLEATTILNRPYTWISATILLCPVLPEGERPDSMTVEMRAAQKAMAAWPKAWRGLEVTASVLQSGIPVDLAQRPQGAFVLINTADGSSTCIANTTVRGWALSPDRRWIAYLVPGAKFQPEAGQPLPFHEDWDYHCTLHLASMAGSAAPTLPPELSADVMRTSLRWSPDGTLLAFLGYAGSRTTVPLVYSYTPGETHVASYGSGDLDPRPPLRSWPHLLWTNGGDLLVYARRHKRASGEEAQRYDWWRVTPTGEELCLTATLPSAPALLLAEPGNHSFVGLVDGVLWRMRLDNPTPEKVAPDGTPPFSLLAWPGDPRSGETQVITTDQTPFAQIIASVRQETYNAFYLVELASGSVQPLSVPTPGATLIACDPTGPTALFAANDRSGTFLWASRSPFNQAHLILKKNTFLRDIASARFMKIDYDSLDGTHLSGWLLVPPDNDAGKPYPLVVWVYPGWIAGPVHRQGDEINDPSALNMQILAANGYAVLEPSMPLGAEGEGGDPMLSLTNGVLPAIDRVIALGIADPQRVYLMGQSYGGYGVYGLIMQTHRFAAAVALAGMSNLISLYGTFGARQRYDDDAHENLFQTALLESAQGRMGCPPWVDPNRYLRNSPLFAVDQVQTPLLIIQGDLDYVALQQGEELFTALYRQGKRATFVRYWGEGHVLEGPANITDMWERILAWFAAFPAPPTP